MILKCKYRLNKAPRFSDEAGELCSCTIHYYQMFL